MRPKGIKAAAAYQAEAVLVPGTRMLPPPDLEPDAAVLWDVVVNRMPEDWFTAEGAPLLTAYCRHACFANQYARDMVQVRADIDALNAKMRADVRAGIAKGQRIKAPSDLKMWKSLHAMLRELQRSHTLETSAMMNCATKLRLTNQARFQRKTADANSRNVSTQQTLPWREWDDDNHKQTMS